MRYKGFTFPGDLKLILASAGKIIYYTYQIKKRSPQDLIEFIKSKAGQVKRNKISGELVQLEKLRRSVNFFLIRILNYPRPCLIRSCILYEQALRNGINVELLIGVKHENEQLIGHSWITIDCQPYREDAVMLQEYTIMMKG